MRVLLQRVSRASVSVAGEEVSSIGTGLLLLVGVAEGDGETEAKRLARKCAEMRIFPNEDGKFNLSLLDIDGEAQVVSQFTLLADTRRGNRPSFASAARPEKVAPLVEAFARELQEAGARVAMGRFGALMTVELANQGPVTIILDSEEMARPRRFRPGRDG